MNKEENKLNKIQKYMISMKKHGFFVLGILLSVSLIRNIYRMSSAQNRIEDAKNRLIEAKNEREKLLEDLSYVTSKEFAEKQARDKLSLVREGEIVIVLPEDEILKKLSPRNERNEATLPDPNWKKWVNLFK